MAALERAVALAEMDRIALAVAEHLEFDVARVAEIFLHIDGGVAERRLGLVARLLHQRFELVLMLHDLHAAPAAARRRLDDHRIADLRGDRLRLAEVADRAVGAGHQRQAELAGGALGLDLVAHRPDMLGLGADPGDVVALDDLGEAGVLAEEAVAGVDRVGVGDFRRGDDRGDVEIAVLGGGPMQIASSASRTCIASASAVEWTATVLMPISWQARWMRSAISPRLAIRILSNRGRATSSVDDDERLVELDRLAVLDQDGA